MSLTTTRAVLLRAHAFGETSRVLRFLTRDKGIVGVMAKGVRSGRRGAGLETFGDGSLVFFHKESRDLHTFKEFGLDRPRHGLGRDPLRLAAASVLADLVLRHGGDADSGPLFDALGSALDDLETAGGDEVVGSVLRGAWGIISVLGYQPDLSTCPTCGRTLDADEVGRFDFAQGGVRCAGCGESSPGPRVGPGARRQLAALFRRELPELDRPHAHLRLLSDFITYHLSGGRVLDTFRIFAALLPAERS
jgi:DNA repair protein RecO (recombination protein O)